MRNTQTLALVVLEKIPSHYKPLADINTSGRGQFGPKRWMDGRRRTMTDDDGRLRLRCANNLSPRYFPVTPFMSKLLGFLQSLNDLNRTL